jgi:hypothetical protein
MIRVNLYLDEERITFLKKRGGSLSEQVRWAIEQYVYNIEKEERSSVSSSDSKRGDSNG